MRNLMAELRGMTHQHGGTMSKVILKVKYSHDGIRGVHYFIGEDSDDLLGRAEEKYDEIDWTYVVTTNATEV